jgi:hypothetical protein
MLTSHCRVCGDGWSVQRLGNICATAVASPDVMKALWQKQQLHAQGRSFRN